MQQFWKYMLLIGLVFLLENYTQAQSSAASAEPEKKQLNVDTTQTDTLRSQLLKDYVPQIYDEIVVERLKCLENEIKLPYHSVVRKHINRYLVDKRDQTQLFVMRRDRYFPIFEEALKRHGLPEEIKYLSIVESALIPKIQSWAAAMGLWQFIPGTGKQFGLYQDAYIDERMDPYKATEAACKYLKYLHTMFGDWHLALAAYNCGPGNVQRAIRRSGNKTTFWEIYNYLPNETRNYVPMFIAMNYVMNHYQDHFVEEPLEKMEFIPSDTILVSQYVNLVEFSRQIEVPLETVQALNPHLKKNVLPYYVKNYPLRIPAEKKEYLTEHRADIFKASASKNVQTVAYTVKTPLIENLDGKQKITHLVRYGEYLSLIAQKYGVKTEELKLWNKLNSDVVYVNQRIVIWKDAPKQVAGTVAANDKVETENKEKIEKKTLEQINPKFHVVQPGDTLWNISKKYEGLSIDKLKNLNPHLKGDVLITGQKIRVG